VDKLWPVYVLDHHGVEHNMEMQPGDMVLYEGAACSHGRPQPLVGDWFANVTTLNPCLSLT
jgi:prolyl 4-hydroxylase